MSRTRRLPFQRIRHRHKLRRPHNRYLLHNPYRPLRNRFLSLILRPQSKMVNSPLPESSQPDAIIAKIKSIQRDERCFIASPYLLQVGLSSAFMSCTSLVVLV